MSKKDVRVYFDAEYCDYLKQVADEQDVSLNHLIVSLVRKKYPMPRKAKPEQPQIDLDAVKKKLDELTKLIDNAVANPSAKIHPKSAYMYLLDEQKRLKALLGE